MVSFVGPPQKPRSGVVSFVGPRQKPRSGVVSFVDTRSTGTGDRDLTRWLHLWNNCIPDFIVIGWVKDIDIITVTVLEIRWRAKLEIRWYSKRTTSRTLYSRRPMSPIYLPWDSSRKLFIYCGTHPPELFNYRPNSFTGHGICWYILWGSNNWDSR